MTYPIISPPPGHAERVKRLSAKRALLRLLTRNPNRIVTHAEVEAEVGEAVSKGAVSQAATALRKILGGTVSRIEGALLYTGTGVQGPRHKLEIWNCSIAADGTFPFIATDPVEFGLKVTVLSDSVHTELFELLELGKGT